MARRKEPTKLLIAKGRKHFTRTEIIERLSKEVNVGFKDVIAPEDLDEQQKERFYDLAYKLIDIGIMTELDERSLAEYVIAETEYVYYCKQIRALMKEKSVDKWSAVKCVDDEDLQELLIKILRRQKGDDLSKLIADRDKIQRAMQATARDLGLTISSRCKIEVPEVPDDEDL